MLQILDHVRPSSAAAIAPSSEPGGMRSRASTELSNDTVTLLLDAPNNAHNQAVVLEEFFEERS